MIAMPRINPRSIEQSTASVQKPTPPTVGSLARPPRTPAQPAAIPTAINCNGSYQILNGFRPHDGRCKDALPNLSRLNRNQKGSNVVSWCNVIENQQMVSLSQRYDERIAGVLSCYDRIVITGTLPTVCYAQGMTGFLHARRIRIFDFPEFASTLRDRVRERAASVAAEAEVTIEHIAKSHIRKEDVVAKVLEQRGDHPGLVHVLSAMEACPAYRPWHDKPTGKTFLRAEIGKCLHYYFYFMDDELGLVYLRVPTWAPFRLQFYCNGHSWLARRLTAQGIGFTAADNAFIQIDNWQRAQEPADSFSPDLLHRVLDRY